MCSQDHGHAVTGRYGSRINTRSMVSGYFAYRYRDRLFFSPSCGVSFAMMSSSYTLIANLRLNGDTSVSLSGSRSITIIIVLIVYS